MTPTILLMIFQGLDIEENLSQNAMRKHVDHLISQLATSPQENSEIIAGKDIETGMILLIDQVAAVIFVKSIKVSDSDTYYSIVKDSNADLTIEN